MIIYLLGNNATCPECSGTLIRPAGCEDYQCINCHAVFEVIGTGQSDRELEIQKVPQNGLFRFGDIATLPQCKEEETAD